MKNKLLKSEIIPRLLDSESINNNFNNFVNGKSTHANLSEDFFQLICPDLFAHLSRVELLVRLLCFEMAVCGYQKISKINCMLFGRAAFFHDIGKVRIPWAILTKSNKLTAKENTIVQEHPKYGEKILLTLKSTPIFSGNSELFDLAVAASLSHHEWWNGSGYPYGIAGQDIPFIARLTSICDVFDAIVYGRPYCNARSANDAFAEIKKYVGLQFDPVISNFFIQHGTILLDMHGCLRCT